MSAIQAIDAAQQALVVTRTHHYITLAGDHFAESFATIPVLFDLKARAAGMYRRRGDKSCIRYNPYLFNKYFDDNLANTVPHEVAHYICDQLYGLRQIRPHGREWRALMQLFGARPEVSCRYDLSGIPLRQQRRYAYRCGCQTHQLSTQRHNKIRRQQAQYLCRQCLQPLIEVEVEVSV